MDITFKDVGYIYQMNSPFEHTALQALSFHVPAGTFLGVVGHTGSGKSTMIQLLNGLLRPTSGEVQIGDFHLSKTEKPEDFRSLRSQVGVVFQYPEHQLFAETVAKDIAFGPENFGVDKVEIEKRVERASAAVGLSPELLERSPFELSGGQMRRVAIAGVLATKPKLLVLDEPTAGLDPRGQQEMMDMFYQLHQEEGLTTVFVTHNMDDAVKYADHLLILNDGQKYMEGKPEEVLTEKDKLAQVQLDVPEMVDFLDAFEQTFKTSIPFHKQSAHELAKEIKAVVKGVEQDE